MSAGTDRLMEFLSCEGYRPSLEPTGMVHFKHEGGFYMVRLDPDDDQYVSIAYQNFWQLRSPEERTRALRAASQATYAIKVAKVVVLEGHDNVWAQADLFVEGPEQLEAVFARVLGAIRAGVSEFVQLMRASEPLGDERITLRREEITRFQHGN